MNYSTKDMVLVALCAAIICILAPLSIPIGPVPISLATFAVMLAGALLGPLKGSMATLIYILLGCVGLPVFSGYTAGFQRIAGVTGGYIIGYLPLAFLTGLVYFRFGRDKKSAEKFGPLVGGMVLGTIVLYVIGTVWYCMMSGSDVIAALALCVTPFLIGDILKIIVITLIIPQLEKVVRS